MPRSYSPVPSWVTTLANYGRLPVRVPGAAIAVAPVVEVVHVNPLTLRQRIAQRFWVLVDRVLPIIESQQSFATWWHYEWYVPQHDKIRPLWATLPTQWWPTLSTTGRPDDLITFLHTCTSQPRYYGIRRS